MKYALDSNIVSYILKGNQKLRERTQQEADKKHQFVITPTVYHEVKYWLLKRNSKSKMSAFKRMYMKQGIGKIDQTIVDTALSIKVKLESKGKSIEDDDLYIAAYCIEHNLVLITNNTDHFKHIKELTTYNWLEE